jgi:two-component system sensor histidine kinase UhpB
MPKFEIARTSLRIRLIVIPACLLVLGILAATISTLYGARERIHSEIDSGVNLGRRLIEYALDDIAVSNNPSEALRQLQDDLAHVRHIQVVYLTDIAQEAFEPTDLAEKQASPLWFQHWFEPPRLVQTFKVSFGSIPKGELAMWSKPSDEVKEVWTGLTFVTGLLGVLSLAMIGLILVTARQTLSPLHTLVEGLDRLEQGQFDAHAEIRVAELRRIGETFNRLARSLSRTEADNHLLIDRLMSVQEAERKELARELHDEFGASLFGIRAAASCIIAAADGRDPEDAASKDIIDRATLIATLADGIQKQNYRILDRIRPVILHQMGLFDALRQLVESWAAHHRDCSYKLDLPLENHTFDEEVSLTSYRVIQECLTNVARHSQARSMQITLRYAANVEKPAIQILVHDDGIGLPSGFRFGFGFLGMSERVRKLGGQIRIANGSHKGTMIEAFIPVLPRMIEPTMAQRLENILAKG